MVGLKGSTDSLISFVCLLFALPRDDDGGSRAEGEQWVWNRVFPCRIPALAWKHPSNLSLEHQRPLREGLSKVQVEDRRRSKTVSLGILL